MAAGKIARSYHSILGFGGGGALPSLTLWGALNPMPLPLMTLMVMAYGYTDRNNTQHS